jgi:hypothetical protein
LAGWEVLFLARPRRGVEFTARAEGARRREGAVCMQLNPTHPSQCMHQPCQHSFKNPALKATRLAHRQASAAKQNQKR